MDKSRFSRSTADKILELWQKSIEGQDDGIFITGINSLVGENWQHDYRKANLVYIEYVSSGSKKIFAKWVYDKMVEADRSLVSENEQTIDPEKFAEAMTNHGKWKAMFTKEELYHLAIDIRWGLVAFLDSLNDKEEQSGQRS